MITYFFPQSGVKHWTYSNNLSNQTQWWHLMLLSKCFISPSAYQLKTRSYSPKGKDVQLCQEIYVTQYLSNILSSQAKLTLKCLSLQLTPPIKGTIIVGMCEGLLHLHSRDIVHQDLKPENIMVSEIFKHSCGQNIEYSLFISDDFKNPQRASLSCSLETCFK